MKDKLNSAQKTALYEEYYLYPDSHQQLNAEELGEDEVAYLRSHKIYNTFSFHQSDALPHMYHLLVEALKANNNKKAIIWIACISHNLNDAASPHFLPSINFLSYSNQKLRLQNADGELSSHADTSSLYMDIAFATEEGGKYIKELRKNYKYKSFGTKNQDIADYLNTLPFYLRNASIKHGTYLLDNYQRNMFTKKVQHFNGNIAVAKLGVIGIKATADIINSAVQLAAKGKSFATDELDKKKTEAKIIDIVKKRKLKDLALFRDVVPAISGSVGVLTESYYEMNESCLGFSSRILAASIMGTLKKSKTSYRAIDLKDVLVKGLPSPGQMPVLIIPACEFTNGYRWIKKQDVKNVLQKYTEKGGRVMWIASEKATFLGDFSYKLKMHRAKDDFSEDNLSESPVSFNKLLKVKGEKGAEGTELLFVNLPTSYAWFNNISYLTVKESDDVIPLASIILNTTKLSLGAYFARGEDKTKAQHACISSAVLFPYTFSNKQLPVATPELDSVSEAILLNTLSLLK